MNIKHLAYRIAHEFCGGVAGLADMMGKGKTVLLNKLNPNSTTHFLTIFELEEIADFTGQNLSLAQFFAEKCNAVVVPLPPESEATGDMNMLEAFMHASVTAGDFAREFTDAWSDGRITPNEFEAMRSKVHAQIASQLGLLAKIEQIAG